MKRMNLNIIIDSLAFGALAFLASSGILIAYFLPPGSGRKLTLWGLSRHDWGDLHLYIALFFLAVIAAHLIMHAAWIGATVKGLWQKLKHRA